MRGFRWVSTGVLAVLTLAALAADSGVPRVVSAFEDSADPEPSFVFEWTADGGTRAATPSSTVNEPLVVQFLDQQVELPDVSAAQFLLREQGVLLSDESIAWGPREAHLLLATLRGLQRSARLARPDASTIRSKWILDAHVAGDLEVEPRADGTVIRIGTDVFTHATPQHALVNGRFGMLHSRRLHHAVVRYITDEGRDHGAVEQILTTRYGISIQVADYERLTRSTTRESEASFQAFHPRELMLILEQLEELPPALRRLDKPIHLVRRLDGTVHPLHPAAPAVSWPTLRDGYTEFMEQAFTSDFLEHTQRLILHEKAHFLWSSVFSDELKARWIELGAWQTNPEAPSGWTCGKATGSVSAHAHAINPAEDLAESFAYFVISPDKLRSRAPAKHDLIQDAIMESNFYLSRIRGDLMFEVHNLAPDYVYPGKIRRVSIRVDGDAASNKVVTVELEIESSAAFDAAQRAIMRVSSELGTYVDLRLRPVDRDGNSIRLGSILRGRFTLSKRAKAGYWWPGQITLSDANGNERFEVPGSFGWRLHIDNPDEDLTAPRYVDKTAWLTLEADETSYARPVQVVIASWKVDESHEMDRRRACSATIVNREARTYSFTRYGTFDAITRQCSARFVISEYAAPGDYVLSTLRMSDAGGNVSRLTFLEDSPEPPQSIAVRTTDPDSRPPEIDLNNVRITARPVYPEQPNGETLVTLSYFARDDRSGVGRVSFSLRDPQGIDYRRYHYHDNFHGAIYRGDATTWTRYETEILLPPGSVPGQWGLSSMQLTDKVRNIRNYDFTETLRFEVLD